MKKGDPSVSGAAHALAEHLRRTFPSVPYETITAITTQHASDPQKCLDLVRLESNLPAYSSDQATSSSTNGDNNTNAKAAPGELYYRGSLRPQGSYIIRRSASPQSTGVLRDSRSCTPPRGSPNLRSSLVRPQSLAVRSVLQHQSLSPVPQRHLLNVSDGTVHSCPGTPVGGTYTIRTSGNYIPSIPALKINYQGGGSQITLTPSPAPAAQNAPYFLSTSGPGNRPVYYLARTTSHGPSTAVDGSQGQPAWQYERRPSFADVEIGRLQAHQRSPSDSGGPSCMGSLAVSMDNLAEGSVTSATSGTVSSVASERESSTLHSPSPNIKIQLDPGGGGGTVISDGGIPRPRPRVTFAPLVTIQQGYHRPTLTVSLGQPTPPPTPIFDPVALAKSTASTHAQVEECLKSVLVHQRARLVELKKVMCTANTRLQELQTDVLSMEQGLAKRRKHSFRSAAISDDEVISLHKETREMQADIQAMLRELEQCKVDNGIQVPSCDAHSQNSTSGVPTLQNRCVDPANPDDASNEDNVQTDQWSCSLCTFRNHVEMPICECCEMPRITDQQ